MTCTPNRSHAAADASGISVGSREPRVSTLAERQLFRLVQRQLGCQFSEAIRLVWGALDAGALGEIDDGDGRQSALRIVRERLDLERAGTAAAEPLPTGATDTTEEEPW